MRTNNSQVIQIGLLLALLLGGAAGCISPMTTRYPQVCGGNPKVERRAYQRTDPLPDRHSGPDTFTRPRGFERQRTEERQSAEQRTGPGMVVPNMYPPGPGMMPSPAMYPPAYQPGPQIPSGAMRYPEAVVF